jgi:serine/threonine protein phosphatase PrpC
MLHTVFVCIVDRDQDLETLNVRLMKYVDAILATLDGKRFGTVIRCTATKHDSSNLFTTGDSRAVRMRWVELSVRTVN